MPVVIPALQVFDVVLNSQHTVVDHLDIFAKVGRAVAHDEIIPFKVEDGQLMLNNEVSSFDGTLVVEFVKVGSVHSAHVVYYLILTGSSRQSKN